MSDSGYCRYCNYRPGSEYVCDPLDPNSCTPCRKLLELEEKVKQTRLLLVGLENERQKLKEQANHNHDRLIHRLPPEIASEVFELCIPDDIMDISLQDILPLNICAPLILSAVCRRWRNIALSTPPLWNTIPLCTRGLHSGSLPGLPLVKEWIDRAGHLPLSILLYVTFDTEDVAIQIINTLYQYSDRWLELRFEGSFSPDTQFWTNQELPQLQRLCLRSHYTDSFDRWHLQIKPTELKILFIRGDMLGSENFSWHHLTQLTIEFGTYSECLEALRRAPNLTKCKFQSPVNPDEDPAEYRFPLPLRPIVHTGLQEFKINALLYEGIFGHLLCPSLKSLSLDFDEYIEVDIPLVVEFLRKSGCPLESLSLLAALISVSDITLLCREIPTLHCLYASIRSSSVMMCLLAHLANFLTVDGKTEPRYLPALHSLHLELVSEPDLDWTMLPDIFGAPITRPAEHHRHALEYVAIIIYPEAQRSDLAGFDWVNSLGEEVLMKILWLKEAGVKWRIQFGRDADDLIALAIDHYGIPSTQVEC